MKLSRDLLAVFKNFSTINPNLTIKPGNKITTISAGKNIIAEATVDASFPEEFGIYDLNEFLGVVSLFESPDLSFTSKDVTIREGGKSVRYFASSPSVLTSVPSVKQFPMPDVEFELSGAMIGQIQRVASILKAGDFSFVGDGQTVVVTVGDKSNPTANTFRADIGTTDKTFKINFKVENLKLMTADYAVAIGAKKIGRFQCTTQPLMYYIAVEMDSEFDF